MAEQKKKKPFIKIYENWCKKCGICTEICPQKVFDLDKFNKPTPARLEDCNQCSLCVVHCPDFAIIVEEELARKLKIS